MTGITADLLFAFGVYFALVAPLGICWAVGRWSK